MGRVIIGDLRTGRRILDLPFTKYSWQRARNTPETLQVQVPADDPDVRALKLRNAATPGKAFIAIIEEIDGGEAFVGAGKVRRPRYRQNDTSFVLNARGIWQHLQERNVLPASALSIDPTLFTVPDPTDTTKTMPNPALATVLAGLDYGTIGKRIIQQAMAWTGGALPIVLPTDVVGTREKTYQGADLKAVGEALEDLSGLEHGPDITFDPRWQADRLGVEWAYRAGTEAQPRLKSTAVHRWDLSVEEESTDDLQVEYLDDLLAEVAWTIGGRSADAAMIERSYRSQLIDLGFPLTERVDSSHSTTSNRLELRSYADEITRVGAKTGELWSFKVKKDRAPFFGTYWEGDDVDLVVKGDPIIDDGIYRRTIAGLAGDEGEWVTVTTAEAYT